MLSKRLVVLACIAGMLSVFSAPVVYANNIIITAAQSSRIQQSSPETNVSDSRLTVRTTPVDDPTRIYKSWIKFDINDIDVSRLETAILTITLDHDRGPEGVYISYVNDNCLDNIDWDSESLTWNNAPGNDINSIGGLDAGKTTELGRINLGSGTPGDTYTIDVTEVLASDTDGIVQFVLHNSTAYMNFASHTHAEEAWRPFIEAKVWPSNMAIKPNPDENEDDVYKMPVLSWTPGLHVEESSPKHKIFFSDNFNDVNDGLGGVTQDANDYAINSPLDLGKTYYWRVDEANSVTGWDPGIIWSFTVEPVGYPLAGQYITVTASSNNEDAVNTIDGSGLDEEDRHGTSTSTMWLSGSSDPGETWIRYDFDKPYKLHQMMVWNYNRSGSSNNRYGVRNATIEYSLNGTSWTTLENVPAFARAPGESDYTSDIVVDFNDLMIKQVRIIVNSNWSLGGSFNKYGLSEVRFLVLPLFPRDMSPADGSTDVDLDVLLSWRSGREAETHEVYFGGNPGSLPLVDTVTGVPFADYDTTEQNLLLGQTYYWQVKEVNTLEIPTTWESDIMSFSTPEFLVVEDFESYNNDSPNLIFETWFDGYEYNGEGPVGNENGNGTGSVAGHDIWTFDSPHYQQSVMETVIVNGGSQSMPLYYDNSGTAQTDRNFSPVQDWTQLGITTLLVHFYGITGNTGRLYVKIGNTKIPYSGDSTDIAAEAWIPWEIDLTSSGASLTNISQLSIGIDGSNADGLLYIDDIRLYPARCILSRRSADFAGFDFVEDCRIDYKELAVIAAEWLTSGSDLISDLNTDNTVNLSDFAALAEVWREQQLWPQ